MTAFRNRIRTAENFIRKEITIFKKIKQKSFKIKKKNKNITH